MSSLNFQLSSRNSSKTKQQTQHDNTSSRHHQPYLALGVQHDGLRLGYPEHVVPAAVEGDAHSGGEVQVELGQLGVQLGSWRGRTGPAG